MSGDGGFASALMLSLLVIVAVGCLAVADAANVLLAGSRARAAADAAALAAAADQWNLEGSNPDPEARAKEIAQANGAELESCDCPVRGAEALVVVRTGTSVRILRLAPSSVSATARARADPGAVFRAP